MYRPLTQEFCYFQTKKKPKTPKYGNHRSQCFGNGSFLTVCVAAFGNVGLRATPVLVVACDRMITIADIEFEPDQTKLVPLATRTVALLAGHMEIHATVCPATRDAVNSIYNPDWTVRAIAERYAEEYSRYRQYWSEQEILKPLGLNFEKFHSNKKRLPTDLLKHISELLRNSGFNAPSIVAGVDRSGPHIYKIDDPGIAISFDTPCFAAIGSGSRHAESYLMTSGFHKQMPVHEVLYRVFAAKMNSEIASGVGSKTDLVIIGSELFPNKQDGFFRVSDQEIAVLKEIHQRKIFADKNADKNAVNEIQELFSSEVPEIGEE